MSSLNLIANLRAALNRRGVTIKMAARMAGRNVDSLERILLGRTQKIDAQMIVAIADKLAQDRQDTAERHRFLNEVFVLEDDTLTRDSSAALMRRLQRLERLVLLDPQTVCFDDQGVAVRAEGCDARSLLYRHLDLPQGRENIVDFAARNLGFVIATYDSVGTVNLRYEANSATRPALIAVRDWLSTHAGAIRRVWRNAGVAEPVDETMSGELPSETIAAIARRILAATPLPAAEWVVERHRLDNIPAALHATLQASKAGATPMSALAATGHLRSIHVYSIIDGEAVALQMSATHSLPTSRYVGRRVLDRPTDREFAAIVDRHLNEALSEDSPTLYRLRLPIGGKQREYWRLAIPDRNSGIVLSAPWEPTVVTT